MIKKVVLTLLAAVLAAYIAGFVFEKVDDYRAIQFANQISDQVTFKPEEDYSRINSVADQFTIPAYVWAKRKITFHKGMWRFSRQFYVKLIVFTESAPPRTIQIELNENTKFLRTSNQFSDAKIFPFTVLDSYSQQVGSINRGMRMRPVIITGAPKVFPKDGMRVTPSLQFASDNANDQSKQWFQVSKFQLPLFTTIFPIDAVYVYE